jgi:hypothetical protein
MTGKDELARVKPCPVPIMAPAQMQRRLADIASKAGASPAVGGPEGALAVRHYAVANAVTVLAGGGPRLRLDAEQTRWLAHELAPYAKGGDEA